jgi:hypothetical protein
MATSINKLPFLFINSPTSYAENTSYMLKLMKTAGEIFYVTINVYSIEKSLYEKLMYILNKVLIEKANLGILRRFTICVKIKYGKRTSEQIFHTIAQVKYELTEKYPDFETLPTTYGLSITSRDSDELCFIDPRKHFVKLSNPNFVMPHVVITKCPAPK